MDPTYRDQPVNPMERLYELFDSIIDRLGYEQEPFCMYRPRGVNIEGYIKFMASTDMPFETHDQAIEYYVTRVARPVSPPPRVLPPSGLSPPAESKQNQPPQPHNFYGNSI